MGSNPVVSQIHEKRPMGKALFGCSPSATPPHRRGLHAAGVDLHGFGRLRVEDLERLLLLVPHVTEELDLLGFLPAPVILPRPPRLQDLVPDAHAELQGLPC